MMKDFSLFSFVAGITLGVLLTGAWFLGGDPELAPFRASSELATSTEKLIQRSGAVAVVDQPSGDMVVIESVTVPPPGVWIAVREMNGSDLGNVLGAARAGSPKTDFTVPLLRATESNNSYAVQLYRDDGGGAFDPAINSVYVDFDTGARVVTYFKTTE